ncbi:MAG: TMEM175 family protein [Verrucomicrobiota bacterium]|nr:TMEM175 family protein [Verrucomicrobiota bacterium]
MDKNRLEAFSDGVLAIIITIMVLELKVPHGSDWAAIKPLLPVFLSYVLSFLYLGIYWNNHHHLLKAARRVNGGMLWANLHLLFWLSLFPFATGWMGQNHFAPLPSALYGMVLLLAAIAYYILQTLIVAEAGGAQSSLGVAIGKDWKGKLSPLLYLLGIVASFFAPTVAAGIYVVVALMWLIPDRRLEHVIQGSEKRSH